MRAKFFAVQYSPSLSVPSYQKLKFESYPNQHSHYLDNSQFTFLNLEHKFKEGIDWNYLGYGKLWAYHLNYFDFLHQSNMDWDTGNELIADFLESPGSRSEGLEPYPISLRVINWIKFLSKHKQYPEAVVNAIFAQYDVLTKKLEYHLLGNHLLENGFALLFGAIFFQDKKLTKLSRKILSKELKEQILEDGAHFELSPMYHVILLQRALDGYNLLNNNKHDLKGIELQLSEAIQKMVYWLNTIIFSSGDIPMLNDSVEGQALRASDVLLYAKRLGFEIDNVKLSDSGYRKFKNDNFEMVADVGEVMPSYQPGHAHSDILNFVLHYKGEPIIVDRGISTYEKNQTREDERSTSSHNTVIINGANQSDVWGGFRVGKRARPYIIDESDVALKATHDGYEKHGVIHQREWIINERELKIIDEIEGDALSAIAYLHFHPKTEVERHSESVFSIGGLNLKIENANKINIEKYLFCNGFNKQEDAFKMTIQFNKKLETTITA